MKIYLHSFLIMYLLFLVASCKPEEVTVPNTDNNNPAQSKITVVGANQHQSSEWAEKGCGNVSTMRIANPTASCHAYYRNLSKFVN